MKTYQFYLLIITIIIFIYIIGRFIRRRRDISKITNKLHIEGLKNKEKCKNASCANNDIKKIEAFGSEESEYKGLVDSDPIQLVSLHKDFTQQPLKEYAIKGSYNTAITGNYVSNDMVKYVLTRGCRYLDLEVLFIDNKPFVTYTDDNKYEIINTDNKILLDNVLTTIVSNAFTQPTPNYEDPLFIHFRLKSNNNDIYKSVAKSIDSTLRGKLYNKKIDDKTKLSDVMGKVVIVMDKSINRKYAEDSKCDQTDNDCYNLPSYINLDSNSDTLYQNTYSDVLNETYNIVNATDKCDICTDVKRNRMVIPDKIDNTQNPNTYELIGKHGCQIIMCRFYSKDNNLYKYEKLFNDNKGGVVPLTYVLDYIKKNE